MIEEIVWVRQVEGVTVHKPYVAIPKNHYLNECKTLLEKFIGENQNGDVEASDRLLNNVKKVDVSIENYEMIIKTHLINNTVLTEKLIPTKFGINKADGKPNFWIHDGRTLNDFNYTSRL